MKNYIGKVPDPPKLPESETIYISPEGLSRLATLQNP
jgi:hypothetical protein